eukprot:jgi/Mesen1/10634/ME000894S10211
MSLALGLSTWGVNCLSRACIVENPIAAKSVRCAVAGKVALDSKSSPADSFLGASSKRAPSKLRRAQENFQNNHNISTGCSKLQASSYSHVAHGRRQSLILSAVSGGSPQASQAAMEASNVNPGVIVGAGRVGQALEKMGGGKDVMVKRGESVPADSTGPIFVCTRNDALDGIVESTPPNRRDDLVFLQNGMLEPWLGGKGLAHATQVLVYFAVAKLGQDPTDGKTDLNPEGLTAASGKWAEAVAGRLHSAGLSCKVLTPEDFEKPMLEKLIWISAFMLVGARHPGASVGDVVELINELAGAAERERGISFAPAVADRLRAYARSVAHFPTAVKEFEWRNGYFYDISKKALADGKPDPCPNHTRYLQEVGAV